MATFSFVVVSLADLKINLPNEIFEYVILMDRPPWAMHRRWSVIGSDLNRLLQHRADKTTEPPRL